MNKGWARGIFIMLLMLSASFAYVIETGDGSKEFAESTAAEKCGEDNVQAVYMCLGNTVRVVSSLSGEGSTFYRPDGRIVHCPVVPPSEMGAECLQLMAPNYCPTEAECGSSAPQVFPGQNDTPEQTGDVDYYIAEEEAAPDVVEEVTVKPESPKAPSITSNVNEAEIPAATPSGFDTILDNLVAVVLMLGMVSVGVLFMMFRTSLQED